VSINWEFINAVFDRLPPLSDDDVKIRGAFINDIERKRQAGWTKEDIIRHMRCSEHFSPDLPEDAALARMAKIRAKYGEV
jgi:hypothetical protein